MNYYTEKFEVGCHHVDENNHVRPSDLVRYMQETANHQMRDRKPSYDELFFEGKAFIITRMSVEIYHQVHQYETIEVRTWSCPGKAATFPRSYQVWRGEELVAAAYSEWAVPNRFTGKLTKTDELDVSGYESGEALELELPRRYRFPRDLEFTTMETKTVRYADCDMNRHMNNANYFDLLWNHIPDVMDVEVTSLNIRFMHEAVYGSEISVGMADIPVDFTKDARAEKAYAFKTVVDGKTNVECTMGTKPVQNKRIVE